MIEAYEKNLVDAIAKGQAMDPLLAKLKAEEARKEDLVRELEQLATADQVSSLDEARLKQDLRVRFADTKGILDRHISSVRRLLRVLMDQPLRCEAVRDGDRKEYRVTGTGSYLPLLPETLAPLNTPQECCSVVNGVPNGIGGRL